VATDKSDVRSKLQQAALSLYSKRGFERTTTAEIAARAGVTERTFFRYFADKKEVLFEGEAEMLTALAEAVRVAPREMGPVNVLLHVFRSFEKQIEDGRQFNVPRQEIIAKTAALRERKSAKAAAMSDALAAALQRRGTEESLAILVARTGVALFDHAGDAWFKDPSVGLGTHFELACAALHDLSATKAPLRKMKVKGPVKSPLNR
jgi:AcrR family transcriptional regulator